MPAELNRTLGDMLRELGNIGCSNALTALCDVTSTEFTIRVPEIELVEYSRMPERLGNVEAEAISVMLDVSGELEAIFLLLLKPEIAARILEAMGVRPPTNFHALEPAARSSLLELGNIMCSSYMNAVCQLTGIGSSLSVPCCAVDMLGAILSLPVIRFAERDSQTLYIRNVFTIAGRDWVGSTLLLPTLATADKLRQGLEALL